jgi:hypothetical protein
MLTGQSSNNDINGFYVLTTVTVNSTIFWDATSCRPVEFHRRFGGMYCLQSNGRRVNQRVTNKMYAASRPSCVHKP